MATLTAERPQQRSLLDDLEEERAAPPQARVTRPAAPTPAAGPTLDDLIAGTWDALAATHAAACPVCSSALRPRYGAQARPVAATCDGCGADLR